MATFAKVCQLVTSCILLNKAARRRLAFPRVSKNLKVAPFQSPPGQMAAFVSLLEAKAKDAGTAKNDYKQVETRSRSMIRCHPAQHCSLRGLSPRPMAHKNIALTTELKEPTCWGKASP